MVAKYTILVISCLIGVSTATNTNSKEQLTAGVNTNYKRSPVPEAALAYGAPGQSIGIPVGASLQVGPQQTYHQIGTPTRYSNSIPAAAIRNVETVSVTKTITPVVTKTTTYKTHSEPALSIGHVQGYSNSAVGQAKIAPVQYTTHYTRQGSPTVGVNGPVTYTGPAVYVGANGGGAYSGGAQVLALAPTGHHVHQGGSYGKALSPAYGAPHFAPIVSYQHAAPATLHVPAKVQYAHAPTVQYAPTKFQYPHPPAKVQYAHAPTVQYAHVPTVKYVHAPAKPQYVPVVKTFAAYGAPHAPAPSYHIPHQLHHSHLRSNSYGVPQHQPLGSHSANFINYMRPPGPVPAASFHRPQYYVVRMPQGQQQRQQQRQPSRTVVETYAAPSITVTRRVPITNQ